MPCINNMNTNILMTDNNFELYFQSLQNDIISHSRQDGRSKDEHRLIFLKTGVISQARGSAYVEQGKTKVMCGVYGPREIPRRSDFSMNGVLSCRYILVLCWLEVVKIIKIMFEKVLLFSLYRFLALAVLLLLLLRDKRQEVIRMIQKKKKWP